MSFLHTLIKYAVMLALYPLRLLGVRHNKVMLISDLTGLFSDSPKYLTFYLKAHLAPDTRMIYGLSDPSAAPALPGVRFVRTGSFLYYIHAITSAVFITDSGGISFIPFSRRTLVINTWHGGGAYKKMFLDYFPHTPANVRSVKMTERHTGLFLSSCEAFSVLLGSAMLMPRKKILDCGLPRNDLMFAPPEKREEVRKKLGLGEKRLCLYAPTFRRSSRNVFAGAESGLYALNAEKLSPVLHARFGGEWVIGFRYHPKIKERRAAFEGAVADYSGYDDMQELLLAADVLINDYSSSMWDFALTGKPCFLLAPDIEDYQKAESFYTPIRSWPFPLAESQEELFTKISEFDRADYQNTLKKHYEALGSFETGHACEKVAAVIARHLEKGGVIR